MIGLKSLTRLLVAGAAMAPLGAAMAQETPATTDRIIVTALKRESLLQEAPLTIVAVQEDALERRGVDRLQDLGSFLPGVHIGKEEVGLEIAIRGVGNRGGNPAVALHQDGVFTTQTSIPIYDVGRVEVLYGPSGTLYGRNSTGGAINIITKRPSHELSLAGQATIGNYGTREYEFVGNLPLGEMAAARFSFVSHDRDGYNVNTFLDETMPGGDDDDTLSGRAQFLIEPSENFEILIRGGITSVRGIGAGDVGSTMLEVADGGTVFAPLAGSLAQLTPFQLAENMDDARAFPYFNPGVTRFNESYISGEINWHLTDRMTATYVGGYTMADGGDSEASQITAFSNKVTIDQADSEQVNQEVRLASYGNGAAGSFDWMLGGYFYRADSDTTFTTLSPLFGAGFAISAPGNSERSVAVFANATWHATQTLSLSAGLRQNWDEVSENAETFLVIGDEAFPTGPIQNFGADFKHLDWRVEADWEWADGRMVYGSVSTGYKTGGANQSALAPTPTYEPEEVLAFEVGSKNTFMDGRLTANFSGFFYDFENYQLVTRSPVDTFSSFIQNASGLEIAGVDFAASYRAGPVIFDVGAEYLHASYDDGVMVVSSDTVSTVDLSGLRPNKSPKVTASFGAEYDLPLPALKGRLRSRADVFLSSSLGFSVIPLRDLTGARSDTQGSYAIADFSVAYEHDSGRFMVEGFVHNAFDEAVIAGYSTILDGFARLNFEPPRVYGARIRVQY